VPPGILICVYSLKRYCETYQQYLDKVMYGTVFFQGIVCNQKDTGQWRGRSISCLGESDVISLLPVYADDHFMYSEVNKL